MFCGKIGKNFKRKGTKGEEGREGEGKGGEGRDRVEYWQSRKIWEQCSDMAVAMV